MPKNPSPRPRKPQAHRSSAESVGLSSAGISWTDLVQRSSRTLPSDVEEFIDYLTVQKNRPNTTVRGVRADLWKFTAFRRHYAPRPFDRLTDNLELREWKELLREYRKAIADVLPHPRSRARALIALRSFLKWANREELLKEDLAWCVEIPRFTVADPHPIHSDDIPKLLDALPRASLLDLRDRALVYFLLTTGCRVSEALSVDRSGVRPEGMRVLGKGGKYRTVYLTQGAWDAVQEYLLARGMDDAPALFINFFHGDTSAGTPLPNNRLTPNGARKIFQKLRKQMATTPELAKILADFRSPHVARHTVATSLLEATDGDVRLVQEVLGHATLETLKVYTEITDKRKAEAYKELGRFLGESSDASSK